MFINSSHQIAQTCIKQLEVSTRFQKTEIDTLQNQIKDYESTIDTLKNFINLLIEINKNARTDDTQLVSELRNLTQRFHNKIEQLSDDGGNLMGLVDKMLDNYNSGGADAVKYDETIKCLNKIRDCLIVAAYKKNDSGCSSCSGSINSVKDGNVSGGGGGSVNSFMLKFDLNEHDSGVSTPISPGQISQNMQQI